MAPPIRRINYTGSGDTADNYEPQWEPSSDYRNPDASVHTLELARLAQGSERWVTVSFIDADRLPLLKTLELRSWGTKRLALEAFAVAPRLTEMGIGGSIEGLERLLLHQLRRLTMMNIWILNTQHPMTIIPHFTNLDTLHLRFYNGSNKLPLPAHDFHSLSLPISSLEIGFSDEFLPTHDRQLLEDLFACFTLPLLGTFRLTSQKYPTVPLAWPHAEFISLSFRPCHHSSRSQYLTPRRPLLPPVVTKILLNDLIPVRLVPYLWSIRLVTRLQFTDRVLLDFVCSRIGRGRSPPQFTSLQAMAANSRLTSPRISASWPWQGGSRSRHGSWSMAINEVTIVGLQPIRLTPKH
ncbi:hypothetical protein C8J57DRAFT_1255519 [Mycena rebaudengoi]|nr:hypothetical protein C8J57DRAFT_1255519 [Mycena rebaudengoi]